jgi:MoaD family protein
MGRARSILIQIPESLRDSVGSKDLAIPARDIRALLEEVERQYPVLHRNICDETGSVRRHVNIFVNTNNMRDCDGLDTPLAPGDVVTILPAVSGG